MVKKLSYTLLILAVLSVMIWHPFYARADITTGLVGWWKFDEGTGTTASDSSSSGDTGTLSGSTIPTWVTGKIGPYALNFTSPAYVALANNTNINFQQTNAFSIAAWVNIDSTCTTGGPCTMFSTQDYLAGSSGGYVVDVYQNNVRFFISDSGFSNFRAVQSTASVGTGAWHFIVVTYDGSSSSAGMRVYIDTTQGNTSISNTNPGTINNPAPRIGNVRAQAGTTNQFLGSMDEVRVYNRVLSQTDVNELYAYPPATVTATEDTNNFITFN